jgi:hypothetical protein
LEHRVLAGQEAQAIVVQQQRVPQEVSVEQRAPEVRLMSVVWLQTMVPLALF